MPLSSWFRRRLEMYAPGPGCDLAIGLGSMTVATLITAVLPPVLGSARGERDLEELEVPAGLA